ncbi:MAG: PD40 domain-containing protein [Anaerolineae bacterium]|nr:PD40 domain-containing protein [Anaerolineae bacterium]
MRSLRLFSIILIGLTLAPLLTAAPAAAQDSCGTAPPPRLVVGQNARVTVTTGTGNNLRDTPNGDATVLGVLAEGEVFNVIDGPQCNEDLYWWQVQRVDGQTGWTAEGVTGDYWLEPWPAAGAVMAFGERPDLPGVQVAFMSSSPAGITPQAMLVDGTSRRGLGGGPLYDGVLAWAPDGAYVAYSDGVDIWIVGLFDALNVSNSTGASNYWPTWSPDGQRVAFVSERDGNPEIYVADLGNAQAPPVNLTNNPGNDGWPAWSPDGTTIAFVSDRDGNMEIYTMNAADGSGLVRHTANTSNDTEPVWSPDGQRLAYTASDNGRSDIWVINSGVAAALTTSGAASSPVFSPDSQRIAYLDEAVPGSGVWDVFNALAWGGQVLQLTASGAVARGLSWMPDGQWIGFADNSTGNYDLYLIRSSGYGLVNLTGSPDDETWPTFQPASAFADGVGPAAAPAAAGNPTLVPPTAEPVNPGEEDLLLVYDAGVPVFSLVNVSGKPVNLKPLSLSGAGMMLPAAIWQSDFLASPLDAFMPGACLMIWRFGLPEQTPPPECGDARQGWVADQTSMFWTQGVFTVLYNDVTVATCESAAGRCVVNLP